MPERIGLFKYSLVWYDIKKLLLFRWGVALIFYSVLCEDLFFLAHRISTIS